VTKKRLNEGRGIRLYKFFENWMILDSALEKRGQEGCAGGGVLSQGET